MSTQHMYEIYNLQSLTFWGSDKPNADMDMEEYFLWYFFNCRFNLFNKLFLISKTKAWALWNEMLLVEVPGIDHTKLPSAPSNVIQVSLFM